MKRKISVSVFWPINKKRVSLHKNNNNNNKGQQLLAVFRIHISVAAGGCSQAHAYLRLNRFNFHHTAMHGRAKRCSGCMGTGV
jgi:hypothetical protein